MRRGVPGQWEGGHEVKALRHRDFRLLWIGQVLQSIGQWMSQIATAWLTLELTDSPLALGIGAMFQAVPFLLVSLWGGVLADRFNRRRLLQAAQLTAILAALAPAVLSYLGIVELWHLYLINVCVSAIAGIDAPARNALAPSLVPRADLMRAVALMAVVRRGTALVGPTIAGVVLATSGAAATFYLNAVCASSMFALTAFIKAPAVELGNVHASVLRSIADGFRYVAAEPFLRVTFLVESFTQSFVVYVGILPVFARDVLGTGPEGLGLLYAAPGVGALVASGVLANAREVRRKGRFFIVTALAKPLVMAGFALSPWFVVSWLALAVYGLLDVAGGTVRVTMVQTITPERLRGRVMGLDNLVHRGLGTLSGLQLGAAASAVGAPLSLLIGTSVTAAFAAYLFVRVPAVARYGEGAEHRADAAARASAA